MISKTLEVPAGSACFLGELVHLLVEGRKSVAEEDTKRAFGELLTPAENGPGKATQTPLAVEEMHLEYQSLVQSDPDGRDCRAQFAWRKRW